MVLREALLFSRENAGCSFAGMFECLLLEGFDAYCDVIGDFGFTIVAPPELRRRRAGRGGARFLEGTSGSQDGALSVIFG